MEQKTEQVGWNLAQHIILELSTSLKNATHNYIVGRYSQAFFWLRSVRLRITPSLSDEQQEVLNKKEKDLYLAINQSKTMGFKKTDDNKIAGYKVFTLFGEYNDLLMRCLKQYGYLIPPKEDKTRLN